MDDEHAGGVGHERVDRPQQAEDLVPADHGSHGRTAGHDHLPSPPATTAAPIRPTSRRRGESVTSTPRIRARSMVTARWVMSPRAAIETIRLVAHGEVPVDEKRAEDGERRGRGRHHTDQHEQADATLRGAIGGAREEPVAERPRQVVGEVEDDPGHRKRREQMAAAGDAPGG